MRTAIGAALIKKLNKESNIVFPCARAENLMKAFHVIQVFSSKGCIAAFREGNQDASSATISMVPPTSRRSAGMILTG
jgi:hypothetical protein